MKVEWLHDPKCAKYIKELDNSDFIPPYNVISPEFGSIPIDWLSGTCKTILQMMFITDVWYPSAYFGDNAARALEEVSSRVDIDLLINHAFKFSPTTKIYFPQYNEWAIGPDELWELKRKHWADYIKY